MNQRLLAKMLSITLLCGCCTLSHSDTMIKVKTVIADSEKNPDVTNPTVTRDIFYRHGVFRRKESLLVETRSSFAQIANCDTKTGFLIDMSTRQYRTYKVARFLSEAQRHEYLQKAGRAPVPVESKTVDTGERKPFFGHLARHLITTTKLSSAKNGGDEEVIDGWYIDHEGPDLNCVPDSLKSEPFHAVGTALVVYPDVAQFQHTGPLPTGLAVSLKMIGKRAAVKNGSIQRTITIEKTVEELSDSPLSLSLFELPGGVHENPHLFRNRTASAQ